MPDFFAQLSAYLPNVMDFLVYAAEAVVTLTGLFKCLIPLWNNRRSLQRAVRRLQNSAGTKRETPIWQETRFMGRRLKGSWQRFLQNARAAGPAWPAMPAWKNTLTMKRSLTVPEMRSLRN